VTALSFVVASGCGVAGSVDRAGLERLLDERFLPHSDWRGAFDPGSVSETDGRDWRTPEEIAGSRAEDAAPLEGLRLALDPGHIGGAWAAHEGREFRIEEGDHWIREGELVLEVALLVRERLESLGAEVILLRETNERVNPRDPVDYLPRMAERFPPPRGGGLAAMADYALELRRRAVRESIVVGELMARAERVNEVVRPDALISLHIDAAPWPETEDGGRALVEANFSHVLVFGAMLPSEFASAGQRERLAPKLGAAAVEAELGAALAESVAETWNLPPIQYGGRNAVPVREGQPYLWARNLMILREADCPAVMIEPFVANSEWGYGRLQAALAARAEGGELPEDDVLVEYAEAVVEGVLAVYGSARRASAR